MAMTQPAREAGARCQCDKYWVVIARPTDSDRLREGSIKSGGDLGLRGPPLPRQASQRSAD